MPNELIYAFNNDLSKQEWFIDAKKTYEVLNPRLVLNPIEFAKNDKGKLILGLFNQVNPSLIYDGIKSTWHRYEHTWPASIDTVHTLKVLNEHPELYNKAKRVLDLGCGIGTCGQYVAEKNNNLTVDYTDIEPNFIKSAKKTLLI